MVTQQVTEVLMNIKQMKENIKEIEQDNAQLSYLIVYDAHDTNIRCAAALTNGELSTNLLSEVSGMLISLVLVTMVGLPALTC